MSKGTENLGAQTPRRKGLVDASERGPIRKAGEGILREEPRSPQGFVPEPVTKSAK